MEELKGIKKMKYGENYELTFDFDDMLFSVEDLNVGKIKTLKIKVSGDFFSGCVYQFKKTIVKTYDLRKFYEHFERSKNFGDLFHCLTVSVFKKILG